MSGKTLFKVGVASRNNDFTLFAGVALFKAVDVVSLVWLSIN